jgi:hypothetical protein
MMRIPACTLVASLLVASCSHYQDPCFTPPSLVDDLRVLALSVDPPEAVADLDAGTVEPVRVRALLGNGAGSGGSSDVSFSVCVPHDADVCPDDTVVARDRDWRRDSSVEIRVSPDLVAAARKADPLQGAGDIRVLVTMRVAGAVPPLASAPILFVRPGVPRNRAPTLDGIRIARGGFSLGPASVSIAMFNSAPYGLRPVLTPGAVEEYDATDFSGGVVHLRERILYSFYATPGLAVGRLQRSPRGLIVYYGNGNDYQAEEPPPDVPEPAAGLIPLMALGEGGGTLWIVARDSRGGTAWLEVPVDSTKLDPRCCQANCTGEVFPTYGDCLRVVLGCL